MCQIADWGRLGICFALELQRFKASSLDYAAMQNEHLTADDEPTELYLVLSSERLRAIRVDHLFIFLAAPIGPLVRDTKGELVTVVRGRARFQQVTLPYGAIEGQAKLRYRKID